MPSSPETTLVAPWAPAELTAAAPVTVPTGTIAPLFEVSRRLGIPEEMLEPARTSAKAAGYAAGWSEGLRAARLSAGHDAQSARLRAAEIAAETHEQAHRAVGALVSAADSLRARSGSALADIDSLVVASAFAIAEAILGASLRDDERRGAAAVARALGAVPDDAEVTVAVHPADHETLLASGARFAPRVNIVADATLAPGDAVARCGATTVDARLAAGVARVRETLGL